MTHGLNSCGAYSAHDHHDLNAVPSVEADGHCTVLHDDSPSSRPIQPFKEDDYYFVGMGDPLEEIDHQTGGSATYTKISNAAASMPSPRDPLRRALRLHAKMLWGAPPRSWSYGRLEAVRTATAWHLTRTWLKTASSLDAALHDLPPILTMGSRIHQGPPLLAPPFLFDELDAVRMVLDAARYGR